MTPPEPGPRVFLSDISIRSWLAPLLRNRNPTRMATEQGLDAPTLSFYRYSDENTFARNIQIVALRRDSWSLGFSEVLSNTRFKEGMNRYMQEWALVFWNIYGNQGIDRGISGPAIMFVEERIEWSSLNNDDIKAACMADEFTLISQVPSRQKPAPGKPRTVYTVSQNMASQALVCTCPGFTWSKRTPPSCRHTLVFEKLLSEEAISPAQTPAIVNDLSGLTSAVLGAAAASEIIRTATQPPPEIAVPKKRAFKKSGVVTTPLPTVLTQPFKGPIVESTPAGPIYYQAVTTPEPAPAEPNATIDLVIPDIPFVPPPPDRALNTPPDPLDSTVYKWGGRDRTIRELRALFPPGTRVNYWGLDIKTPTKESPLTLVTIELFQGLDRIGFITENGVRFGRNWTNFLKRVRLLPKGATKNTTPKAPIEDTGPKRDRVISFDE